MKNKSLLLLLGVTLINAYLMSDALTKTEQMHQKSLALVEASLNSSLRQAEDSLTLGSIDAAQVELELSYSDIEQVKSLMEAMPVATSVKP